MDAGGTPPPQRLPCVRGIESTDVRAGAREDPSRFGDLGFSNETQTSVFSVRLDSAMPIQGSKLLLCWPP